MRPYSKLAATAVASLPLFLGRADSSAVDPHAGSTAPPGRFRVSDRDRQDYIGYQAQMRELISNDAPKVAMGSGQVNAQASSPTCLLFRNGANKASAQDCLACHGGSGPGAALHTTHPVDVDYGAAQISGGSLRPMADAVQRGVFLPDGKVECVTCHAPASPWKYHLALPRNQVPRPAVRIRDPGTYEEGPRAQARAEMESVWKIRGAAGLSDRDVTPTPLCLSCHTFGD